MESKILCSLLLLSTFATLVICSEVQRQMPKKELNLEWGKFIKSYAKSYKTPAEELKRRLIWENNLDFIEKHSKSNASFQMKMNKFGDLTFQEFKKKYAASKPSMTFNLKAANLSIDARVPDSTDWRPSGCVAQPVDEGECGANWAFAVIGSIESLACLNHQNVLNILSVQQVVDCTINMGNTGCEGGYFQISYEYLVENGVELNASYPYAQRLESCKYDESKVKVMLKDYARVQSGSETLLTNAIATLGPITAGVYVTDSFQFYSGGIYYDTNCRSDETDLGGLIVGYGTLGDNRDYYIFRNNWGSNWGDDGYIYMARNRDNNCGIATDCYYPVF